MSATRRRPDNWRSRCGSWPKAAVNLARSVAAQRRYDESIALWGEALTVMDGVASERNRREAKTIHATTTRWMRRGIPGAAGLSQRAAEVART
ncbi:hypothetical protein [Streptomyces sp. NBC_00370]|uniref:hypothetical protein n=1 Tax=Streptomyces sp. NBC_00370 TaxID=2975728 RepID=UPI002E26CD48